MKIGDLIQTNASGQSRNAPYEPGIIVGIVDTLLRRECFEVLMSGSGDIIHRWKGDMEVNDESR